LAANLRYLLLQARNQDDPMRHQEVRCFAHALGCDPAAIAVFDLLSAEPATQPVQQADMVLLGGSGHYSAVDGGQWLEQAFETLREVHCLAKPTFASCWGFQAIAGALGGRCIHDPDRAEVGTIELRLTETGRADPLFGQLPPSFAAQAGHRDHVVALPPDAVLLASSALVPEQAYRFTGRPIYCTQFHPELKLATMAERLRAYPEYTERIAGVPHDQFLAQLRETPEANTLLRQFVKMLFG
jgi:GMP synthase (glutamine-hydrolysing)